MDLFFDIFWTLTGAVLTLLLCVHIFRRFAAPYRLKVYLNSGKVIRLYVRSFTKDRTSFSWVVSKWLPQSMIIPDFDSVVGIHSIDRRYNF